MANFGLSKPWIAKLNVNTNTYSNALKCGRLMTTTVTPNVAEGTLRSDNMETEKVVEFINAAVTVGVDTMPAAAVPLIFGHSVDDDGTETDNSDDSASYVGYGFVTAEMLDGVKGYRACVLHKVKFKEGEEGYTTKGESISFSTPSLSGTATTLSDGRWRTKSPQFDTETEADAWIQEMFGVGEDTSDGTTSDGTTTDETETE